MAIEAVKIPQNVYVEDRIIGPVTLRQIMLTLGGAGVSYGIWAAMKAAGPVGTVQTIIAWIPCLIFIAFAFIKINGISLTRIALLALEKLDKPSMRKWHPRKGIHINVVLQKTKKSVTTNHKDDSEAEGHFQTLSEVLDRGPGETPQEETDRKQPAEIHGDSTELKSTDTITKAVNPRRVRTDSLQSAPIDDIRHPEKMHSDPKSQKKLFRDINPPQPA